jgi:predicted DCC family thiol-disulfide oxidoreductase YuxK
VNFTQNDMKNDMKTIIFFDGVCNFCNGVVNWLIAHDPHECLLFASLQGETYLQLREQMASETASKTLPTALPADVSSIVVWSGGRAYTKSAGVLVVAGLLGGVWGAIGGLARLMPASLRDAVYGVIARNRYRWFGRTETCRIPTEQERKRFLA